MALNSDELGERGEVRFRDLCLDAHLVANKADRDRCGWDFIVEFPHAPGNVLSLDHRQTPLSCHVQVKSIYETSKTIRMRLSAAERLAKDLKPTFIYIFRFDDQARLADTYLVHLVGARLAEILKRLRKESAKGTRAEQINSKYISITPDDSERIEPTGGAFASIVRSVCSDGMDAYSRRKSVELRTLGFNGSNIEMSMQIHADSTHELVDIFLGLKKNARMTNSLAVENRFGIKIPINSIAEGFFTIEPNAVDKCAVIFQAAGQGKRVSFVGDLYVPGLPGLPFSLLKLRVDCEVVDLTFVMGREELTVGWNMDVKRRPADWAKLCLLWSILADNDITVAVRAAQRKLDVRAPLSLSGRVCSEAYATSLQKCFDQISRIFDEIGFIDMPEISFSVAEELETHLLMLGEAMSGASQELIVSCVGDFPSKLIGTGSFGVSNTLQVDEFLIAYFGVADFDVVNYGAKWRFSTNNFRVTAFKLLREKSSQEFNNFSAAEEVNAGLNRSLRFGNPEDSDSRILINNGVSPA